jgi:hypothetical protein
MSGSETDKAPEAITQGTRYPQLYVGEFTALTIGKDGGAFSIDAEPLYQLVRNYVLGVPSLQSSLERTERELREAKARVLDREDGHAAANIIGARLEAENKQLQEEAEALISNAATEMHKRESAERENQRLREALEVVSDVVVERKRPERKLADIAEIVEAALSNPSNPEKGES